MRRNRAAADWLTERRNGNFDDEAKQSAIRERAMAAIGSLRDGHPTRSARASELVREIIAATTQRNPGLRSYPPDFYPG